MSYITTVDGKMKGIIMATCRSIILFAKLSKCLTAIVTLPNDLSYVTVVVTWLI